MKTPHKVSKKGPRKMGQIKTSQMPLTKASPKRPASQTKEIAGNFPINFGVGSKSSGGGNSMKTKKRGGLF